MFRGVHSISLDVKGRLAVPTRYRERLADLCGGRMVVTLSPEDRCLWLYPLPEWEQVEESLSRLPSFDRHGARLRRLLMSHAVDVSLDGSGRILLPQVLRSRIGIDRQLALLGMNNKFEIWDEAHWNSNIDGLLTEEYDESQLSEAVKSLVL